MKSLVKLEKGKDLSIKEILIQYNGPCAANKYSNLYDRLGSVRQVINSAGDVVNRYSYNPFGEMHATETEESLLNPFKYTGQYFDSEIGQYYLRARQYEPYLGIFTANDPVDGKFEEPLTLHKYLYCTNDPINRIDPLGLYYTVPGTGTFYQFNETQTVINAAIERTQQWWKFNSWWTAFGNPGDFDYTNHAPELRFEIGVNIGDREVLTGSEFTNYLIGYTAYYQGASYGIGLPLLGAASALGDAWGASDWWGYHITGNSDKYKRFPFDDFGSKYYLTKGAYDVNRELFMGLGAQLDGIVLGAAVWNLNILRQLNYFDYDADTLTWGDLLP